MTLNVPLSVSVDGTHITPRVSGLAFRKEAVGGLQNVTLSLSAPLDTTPLTPLGKVLVMDTRSAKVIGQADVADPGRTADQNTGQTWSMTAFGPAAHASDINQMLQVIDQSLDDGWRRVRRADLAGGEIGKSTKPGTDNTDAIVAHVPASKFIDPDDHIAVRYERIRDAEQRLGRVKYDWDAGVTDTNFKVRAVAGLNNTPDGTAAKSSGWNTAGGSHTAVYTTDFTLGRNQVDLEAWFDSSLGASFQPPNDRYWASFANVIIRSVLSEKDGTDQACSSDYVEADWVIRHLLGGGWLPLYDAVNASIDTGGVFQIDQMAYPDGISPREVLDDLMALEPGYFWTTGPDITGLGYQFWWKPWPTTVRYEATLEDGGDFPTTTRELYNRVTVRWVDKRGRAQATKVSGACPTLDNKGRTRRAILDIADELGSSANAAQLGANFLAEHKYPPNAGTLNVARKIRDLTTGRMIDPHEIEPAELIRVRGIESSPDSLNASSSDGETVFRIWAMNYTSENHTAALELDTYPRTTAQALANLQRRRERKR